MGIYILRRLVQVIFIIVLVTILIFLAMQFLPGGPLLLYINEYGLSQLSPETVAQYTHEYGLDRPLIVQYFSWVNNLLHGDFGTSIVFHVEVSKLLAQALPITLHLGISFLLLKPHHQNLDQMQSVHRPPSQTIPPVQFFLRL